MGREAGAKRPKLREETPRKGTRNRALGPIALHKYGSAWRINQALSVQSEFAGPPDIVNFLPFSAIVGTLSDAEEDSTPSVAAQHNIGFCKERRSDRSARAYPQRTLDLAPPISGKGGRVTLCGG